MTKRITNAEQIDRIPLLDITTYYRDRDVFVEELRHACHTVGFFLIRHHDDSSSNNNSKHHDDETIKTGIPPNPNSSSTSSSSILAQQMLDETRRFFDRPLNDKMTISYEDSPSFRGYMPIGVENTAGSVDHREQIEYAVEYSSDIDNNSIGKSSWPDYYNRLKASRNPWPTRIQPTLEPTTKQFASHVCHIADCIRDAMSLALKVDPTVMRSKFGGKKAAGEEEENEVVDEVPHWVIKLISYPPAVAAASSAAKTAPPEIQPHTTTSNENECVIVDDDGSNTRHQFQKQNDQQQQGVGAHTDTNFLTLLLQDEVGGLQAFSQGEWIDVDSSSSSSSTSTTTPYNNTDVLVCNLGEQAEIWSRGYFRATPHRVLMNRCKKKSRVSVPLFYNPTLSATIEPIDESQLSKLPWDRDGTDDVKRRKVGPKSKTRNQFWHRPNNSMLRSVGENTFKSLARSHPIVFNKHHPDLQLLDDGRIVQTTKAQRGDNIKRINVT